MPRIASPSLVPGAAWRMLEWLVDARDGFTVMQSGLPYRLGALTITPFD